MAAPPSLIDPVDPIPTKYDSFAWQLYVELRKEVLQSQKLRTQFVGFKITVVAAAIGLIAANRERVPEVLLVIPAFAAVFFDLIIASYSSSIQRIGLYCETVLEKKLAPLSDFKMWEAWVRENPHNIANHTCPN